MPEHRRIPINNSPEANEIWAGIGGHFDNYCQILCEFIDNSISNFLGNDKCTPNVKIFIKRNTKNNTVKTIIEDSGTGIKDLESALTLGSKRVQESPLNEHGFGLKHALASANPSNSNWRICTRDEEDCGIPQYKEIMAPYSFDSFATIKTDSWPGSMNGTGTVIEFETSDTMFRTIGKGIRGGVSKTETIIDILKEDLGYIYSGAIKDGKVSIGISYSENDGDTERERVSAVEPKWLEVYRGQGKNQLEGSTTKDLGGGPLRIKYKFGKIEESSELKRYYKCNQASSGAEIRINGRMLQNNLFERIWGRAQHNAYNALLIQIDLIAEDKHALPVTRTSKNGLREGDEVFDKLCEWIRTMMPEPERDRSTRYVQNEIELFEMLKELKDTHLPEPHIVKTQQHAFTSIGEKVRIDLYISLNGEVTIYEGKMDSTSPLDAYQLRMYWDGLVFDGITPQKAILIAAEHPESVQNVISVINKMTDANGKTYNIVTKTWREECINYPE